ncbi:MAG: hypothetical protein OXH90_03580 [Paracoccaceae bacterium]|nr:hypothetical protein [Paracoccaceae bacterium]MDE2916911.1 hypothetical protein [Paracoccaceae bacterium]
MFVRSACMIDLPRDVGFIAIKVYGDEDHWREIAKLNNISKDNRYKVGDCLKVFDVAW